MYILPNKVNLAYVKHCDPLDGVEVIPESVGQFTGLHDKNVKEIYEGDVMKDKLGAVCQVVYATDYGGYRQLSKIGYSPLNQAEIIASGDIIIGNIYENPELLNA